MRASSILGVLILALGSSIGGAAEPSGSEVNAPLVEFDLPAQPLAVSLRAVAAEAQVSLLFDTTAIEHRLAPALKARLTLDEALSRLLAGSGLTHRRLDERTIVLGSAIGASHAASDAPVLRLSLSGGDAGSTAGVPAAGEQSLEEIVVSGRRIVTTATKTDIPLLETPQAISVITQQMLELRNVQRIKDALRLTAGVQVDKYGGDTRFDQIELRGFSATEFGEYRDGLRQVSSGAIYFRNEPYGLESIEVLKGPSSVLFGQNAPGGLFNQISKRPTPQSLREFGLDLGSFSYRQLKADVGGSLSGDGRVYFRLTGLARDAETHLDGESRDDRVFVAPGVTWEPSESTKITLYAQYLQSEGVGSPFGYTDDERNFVDIRTYDPNYDRLSHEQLLAGWSFAHAFGERVEFRQNARYARVSLAWLLTDALINPRGVTLVEREQYQVAGKLRSYAIDNQLATRFELGAARLNLLAGYDFTLTQSDERDWYSYGEAQGVPSFDLANPVYGVAVFPQALPLQFTDREDRQGGFYLQGQAKLGGWNLTAGVRNDRTSSDIADELVDQTTRQRDDATTYRLGVLRVLENGLAPYVSYSTSFQLVPGRDFFGRAFLPSDGRQIEAGVKYQPGGFPGFMTLSAYELTQDNVLVDDPEHFEQGFSTQAGQIRGQGIELEGSFSPVPALSTGAAFTFQDVEFTADSGVGGLLGNTPNGTPSVLASAWANYVIPGGTLSGVGFGGALRYSNRTYVFDTGGDRNDDAATYLDAFVSYETKRWRLGLNVSNVLDEDTITCPLGFCYQVVGRSVIGSATYRY